MALELERVAVVRGADGAQGSGVLLTSTFLLSAGHVVGNAESVTAAVRGGTGWTSCTVVVRVDDVVLLQAARPLVDGELSPLPVARPQGLIPLPGCHATGFPAAERDAQETLGSHQVTGTLKPGPGRTPGRRILETAHRPPTPSRPSVPSIPSAGTDSPWAGLSGAGVFHGTTLLGIVTADHSPARWGHSQLEVQELDEELSDALLRHASKATVLVPPPTLTESEAFELDYRESLHAQYGRIRIFGLDLDDRVRDTVDRMELDTAYLSLSAHQSRRWDILPEITERRTGRAETLLADRTRTLLRGGAGSGKTTLVQWLALHAAELSGFEDRIPFVLKLRSLHKLPRPGEFLVASRSVVADSEPRGWTTAVLRAGRGLLLVDGVDEIPENRREGAREWLSELLRLYPGTAAVVTARPSAVRSEWLAADGFEELTLLPMTGEDRKTFVDLWHRAAGAPGELREGLLRTLDRSPALTSLTASPLLCAMLCALHRNRNGALPQGRMAIYAAALSMLLARRDMERQVEVELSEEDHLALLQGLAHWLVKEGRVEGDRADAVNQIRRLQGHLSTDLRGRSAESLYAYVLERSGLLYEPTTDTFEFIHRTFQDYLAAKEFSEDRSFNSLLSHADDEQWADVIRMTVGHCAPRDRSLLLERLGEDPRDENRALLAGSCLPFAPRLAPETRALVLDRLEPLVHTSRLRELDRVGDDVLTIVPPTIWAERSSDYATLLGRLGTSAALRTLATGIDQCRADNRLDDLTTEWRCFDAAQFADLVLAPLQPAERHLFLSSREHLRELDRLGSSEAVTLFDLSAADLRAHKLPPGTSRVYVVNSPDLEDLELLSRHTTLRKLTLSSCPALSDLGCIPALRPESLSLWDLPAVPTEHLREIVQALDSCTEICLGPAEVRGLAGRTTQPGVRSTFLNAHGEPGEDQWLGEILQIFPALGHIELLLTNSVDSFDLRPLINTTTSIRVSFTRDREEEPQLTGGDELGKRLTVHRMHDGS
ncbi:NACHT domain-containing protein [Streptacidiphilus fuscans]|uniref:NACHT domain-containing protein n=1 Tax=Streptacidiphilus fuscans TaxID=2789292 RepID=A0A931FJ23_9ACTN|nr:NACHT domain-containing protein [Streptacidiphilus fuscans]MBF9073521.1 NACHT domain-containing protein [Streptacidiphilus fuscans]